MTMEFGDAHPPASSMGKLAFRQSPVDFDGFGSAARIGSGGFYRLAGKRMLDTTLVLLALPVLLLVMLPVMLLVASDGHSPFYTQTRIGRNGRLYRMWKFRSMVVDADAALERHFDTHPEARAEWARRQKLDDDPRVTRVGQLIRKTSIDELPQLWNVLKGDMSLVGPRPMMENQRDLYPGARYYRLRPGITGVWQVSARNAASFSQRAHYDNLYDRRLSLKTDIKLLLATIRVVLRATGQ
jgi:lipopolysaccharide/colanic/teichoic acid biosynthesis glycosyltransferase